MKGARRRGHCFPAAAEDPRTTRCRRLHLDEWRRTGRQQNETKKEDRQRETKKTDRQRETKKTDRQRETKRKEGALETTRRREQRETKSQRHETNLTELRRRGHAVIQG